MTNPSPACVSHPHLAQRTQSAAACPQKEDAAAPPIPTVAGFALAVFERVPVPKELRREA